MLPAYASRVEQLWHVTLRVIVAAVLLFLVALGFIRTSIESWFSVQVEGAPHGADIGWRGGFGVPGLEGRAYLESLQAYQAEAGRDPYVLLLAVFPRGSKPENKGHINIARASYRPRPRGPPRNGRTRKRWSVTRCWKPLCRWLSCQRPRCCESGSWL